MTNGEFFDIGRVAYITGDVQEALAAKRTLEKVVESANGLQQLKAEIAAIANDLDRYWRECKYNEFHQCTERLRQLSAV
jgi:hypothetical protein